MHPTRRRFLGAVTASAGVGLAGCTGDGDGTPTGTGESSPGTDAGDGESDGDGESNGEGGGADGAEDADGEGSGQATVQVRSHDEHGDILVGPDGLTLYNFDSDEQGAGESTCEGGCLEAWPPLTVDSVDAASTGDGVTADLTTFERGDGTIQVAANGWPLYYYASDGSAGDAQGQGASDVWWVLDPDGEPLRSESDDDALEGDNGTGDDESDGGASDGGGESGDDRSGVGSGGGY